jgi:tRNA pseudouridine65 synthase
MPPKPPKTLFEDDHLLAVSKPRGLLTVGNKPGQKNLLNRLKHTYEKQSIRLRPLNRLDRGTSGIVLFAKTKECFENALNRNRNLDEKKESDTGFNSTKTQKTYIAILKGTPRLRSGTITFPLPSRQDKRKVLKAKTKYKVIDSKRIDKGSISIVEARISSGRYHQIRRHFTKIHHSLLMDREYMDRKDYKYWVKVVKFRHFFLHSAKLTFQHFVTGEEIIIEDSLPKEFKRTLKLFDLDPFKLQN